MTDLQPIEGPSAWRGDHLEQTSEWIRELNAAELEELTTVARRFIEDDPDLRTVVAADYQLAACAGLLREICDQLDAGRGFILVRGLDPATLGDELSGAIFFLVNLHVGSPMQQSQVGDLLDHIVANSDKLLEDPGALPSRIRDQLPFHSDSSDVVSLLCLRGARRGGASLLVSGSTIYNVILERRPDLAPLLFRPFHWDWRRQDHDAPAPTYTSPVCSHVDGVFSTYAGSTMVFSAQDYPGVPPLTDAEREVLELYDEVSEEAGLALSMDFRPGDMQFLLNYAALHSRTAYEDSDDPAERRHLLRMWLRRDVGRPIVDGFGKNAVVADRSSAGDADPTVEDRIFHIRGAVVPDMQRGL
ncbi:MAG: TauD/TfdA family dioxygenase [Actinomycetota bacterium]